MMRCEPGDIVRVSFRHVEEPRLRSRPALVVSAKPLEPEGLVIWAVMITSAARADWPGDVLIPDDQATGLPIPSRIRTAKIATLQAADADTIGHVDDDTMQNVIRLLRANLPE